MARRRLFIVLGVLVLALGAAATANAQGAFLYRDADLRFEARLDPEGMREVERTWRFDIPPGARQIEIRRHWSNEGEATLAFGTGGPDGMSRITHITPSEWETPWPWGARHALTTGVSPGPYEIQVSAKAPARFVIGVYFHEEPHRGGR